MQVCCVAQCRICAGCTVLRLYVAGVSGDAVCEHMLRFITPAALLALSCGRVLLRQVMPYVSLCAQKAAHLQKLLEPLGREVKSLYGGLGGVAVTPTTGICLFACAFYACSACKCDDVCMRRCCAPCEYFKCAYVCHSVCASGISNIRI
jgi:hypothetical protein